MSKIIFHLMYDYQDYKTGQMFFRILDGDYRLINIKCTIPEELIEGNKFENLKFDVFHLVSFGGDYQFHINAPRYPFNGFVVFYVP